MQNTDFLLETELFIRIILALVCGAVIGYERNNRGKGAGLRTHSIVAIASCLMMIISQYGFNGFFAAFDNPEVKLSLDPARIAAQIVSGIGFLGAGMIFIQKNVVTGLTTAAGIWATAGIGMAIGAGMYFIGIVSTVIIYLVQVLLHAKSKWLKTNVTKTLTIYNVAEPNFKHVAAEMLEEYGIFISDTTVIKHGKEKDYTFFIDITQQLEEDVILEIFDYDMKIGGSM